MSDSDEQYRRVVELSPDGIFIFRDSRIVFVNPAAVRIFGASSADEVLGRSPFDFFHIDQHIDLRDRVSKMLAGDSVPVNEERASDSTAGSPTSKSHAPCSRIRMAARSNP